MGILQSYTELHDDSEHDGSDHEPPAVTFRFGSTSTSSASVVATSPITNTVVPLDAEQRRARVRAAWIAKSPAEK